MWDAQNKIQYMNYTNNIKPDLLIKLFNDKLNRHEYISIDLKQRDLVKDF